MLGMHEAQKFPHVGYSAPRRSHLSVGIVIVMPNIVEHGHELCIILIFIHTHCTIYYHFITHYTPYLGVESPLLVGNSTTHEKCLGPTILTEKIEQLDSRNL
jgi:hypothetical protein